MAYFSILQAANILELMDLNGVLTALVLPAGVTINSRLHPRFTVYGRHVIIVNSPSRPLIMDVDGTLRVLSLRAPRTVPVLSGTGTSTLSGTFMVRQSFLALDGNGNILSESAMGPSSAAYTVTHQFLQVSNLDVSPDTVSASRIYRTTTNGTVFYPWFDVDGNTQTVVMDDLADAGLRLVAAPTLGSIPDLTLIKEFRERLWGVSRTSIDTLRYSESQMMYSWPAGNQILVPRVGSDDRGVTAIIPRREGLSVARQDILYQVTGETTANFRLVKIKETIGVEATDSVVVYRDAVYFLAKDGVYVWDDTGVHSLTDGITGPWFTTDVWFNRSKFRDAVGRVDPTSNKYHLLLAAAGSNVLDRWIELDLTDRTWWGPHKTEAFTPTVCATLLDVDTHALPVFGSSNGFVWQPQELRTDDIQTAIDFEIDTKFHDGGTPDIEKEWQDGSLITVAKAAKGNLSITPRVGTLTAQPTAVITPDLTLDRQRMRRLGHGRFLQLNFRENSPHQDVELFGYEIPFFELGRR